MNTIILSKYLLRKAENSWQLHDPFSNGLTVSLLQDSAEMLVWEMAKTLDVKIKPKESFVSLLDNIDHNSGGINLKAQILEVNSARVNFKHYGNIPSSVDIPKFIENTKMFLESNASKIGYNFKDISLADIVRNSHVKDLIKKAENFLTDENIKEALIHISMAFSKIEKDARDLIFENMPNIEDAWKLFPRDTQDEARYLFADINNFLGEFTHLTSLMGLGYSKNHILDLRHRCLSVNISVSGKIIGIHARRKAELSRENVEYLIRNITDMSISLYG